MITKDQSKLIHLARRRINMTDPDYRAMLQRVAGVTSSNDLDDSSMNAVMEEFGRLGFPTVRNAPQYGERWGWATPNQIDKIRSLWRRFAGTEDEIGLKARLEKNFQLADLRFLDFPTAQKVIVYFEHLVLWRKTHPRPRKKREASNPTPTPTRKDQP